MSAFWIDIDNLPHVTIFEPVIHELRRRGHRVELSARDVAYSVERLEDLGLSCAVIGRAFGKAGWRKVAGTLARALRLRLWLRGRGFDLGLSHGSRSAVLASALAGLPCVTMYDYEHVSTGLQERFANHILVPGLLMERGIFSGRPRYEGYPGYKEEIYLGGFRPDPAFRGSLGLPEERVLAVLRPPARQAHYHNPRAEGIFRAVIQHLKASSCLTLVAPRNPEEREELAPLADEDFRLLDRPVDGLQLVYAADLVISGGGTMNREAALLGTPVWSIFQGRRALLDEELAVTRPFHFVESVEAVQQIRVEARERGAPPLDGSLLHALCDRFEQLALRRGEPV